MKARETVLLTLMAALLGMLAFKHRMSPFHLADAIVDRYHESSPSRSRPEIVEPRIDPTYLETDAGSLIDVRDIEDAEEKRDDIRRFLWGDARSHRSSSISERRNVSDERFGDIRSLSRMDKIEIVMEFGISSVVHHLFPENPNGDIVFYHQGHRGGPWLGRDAIERLLDEGYSVMAFSMPLVEPNNKPVVFLDRFGRLELTHHSQLKFLEPERGHPLKFFVEPVIAMLDHVAESFSYGRISMIGISGGGWTTHIAAAIDPRIGLSFPVAGSYPVYLRSGSARDWGDYEQTVPEFYRVANYPELYVLASIGEGRGQLQIINVFDSCCFAGVRWKTYRSEVRRAVENIGVGDFDVFSDDSHDGHVVSENAIRAVLTALEAPLP